MIDINQQIPDEEFVNEISKEDYQKIQELLKELNYIEVQFVGSIYMIPNVFMGWDTEFYETNDKNEIPDTHREFIKGSPTRNKMEEILAIFLENKLLFDTKIHIDYDY